MSQGQSDHGASNGTVQSFFIVDPLVSFDEPWSKQSCIVDLDPDSLKGIHPQKFYNLAGVFAHM